MNHQGLSGCGRGNRGGRRRRGRGRGTTVRVIGVIIPITTVPTTEHTIIVHGVVDNSTTSVVFSVVGAAPDPIRRSPRWCAHRLHSIDMPAECCIPHGYTPRDAALFGSPHEFSVKAASCVGCDARIELTHGAQPCSSGFAHLRAFIHKYRKCVCVCVCVCVLGERKIRGSA